MRERQKSPRAPERDQLLDFVLGELTPQEAEAIEAELAAQPASPRAHERDSIVAAMGLIREAASLGWETEPRGKITTMRWLKPALAIAAVLAIGFTLLITQGNGHAPRVIYEPDMAHGYLLPEETDAAGASRDHGIGEAYTLRAGEATVASVGSTQEFPLAAGQPVPSESEIRTTDAARIDLPHGGVAFAAPFTDVRVRRHDNGDAALRLMRGSLCVVVGSRPVHMAVHGTDLLLEQKSGASMLRTTESDALCFRGTLELKQANQDTFRIPEGSRLPSACAREPITSLIRYNRVNLDWYFELVYGATETVTVVEFQKPGVSAPIDAPAGALLYLSVLPNHTGVIRVSFGEGAPRKLAVVKGERLRVRIPLHTLGKGPVLRIESESPQVIAETHARLFTPQR